MRRIDDWRIALVHGVPCIFGTINGASYSTSEVIDLGDELEWVQTLYNRFELGVPSVDWLNWLAQNKQFVDDYTRPIRDRAAAVRLERARQAERAFDVMM